MTKEIPIETRRILVTGGAGFIGSNFAHHWAQNHPRDRIVVLDALTYAGNRETLADLEELENFRFIHGNICDYLLLESILQEEQIDTIAHFAAESHVDRSILEPKIFIETNILGTFNLLETFRHHWLSQNKPQNYRFLNVSTDEVYGSLDPAAPPFSETTAYSPNSPYSASKASGDHLVRAYYHTYGLPTIITNCSNNYGPYHFPEKLIPLMIINILLGKPLPVYGDGQNVRDWLYVEDHTLALDLIIHKGTTGETYNIGGSNEIKNLDLVNLICKLINELEPNIPIKPAERLIEFVEDRPGHDRRYAINSNKVRNELAWNPDNSLADGLRKTILWYLNNRSWWYPLLSTDYQLYYEINYQPKFR
jgi:dTDP-glucose 4,6-dehydratase